MQVGTPATDDDAYIGSKEHDADIHKPLLLLPKYLYIKSYLLEVRGAARRPTAGEMAAVSSSLQNQAAGNTPCLLPNTANKTQVGATWNGAHAACLPFRSSRHCWQRTTAGPTSAIPNQGSQADCGQRPSGPQRNKQITLSSLKEHGHCLPNIQKGKKR
jgi:hypothetical protein